MATPTLDDLNQLDFHGPSQAVTPPDVDSLGIPMQGTPAPAQAQPQDQEEWGLSSDILHKLGADNDSPLGIVNKAILTPVEAGTVALQGLGKAYDAVGNALPHGALRSIWELPEAFATGSPELEEAHAIAAPALKPTELMASGVLSKGWDAIQKGASDLFGGEAPAPAPVYDVNAQRAILDQKASANKNIQSALRSGDPISVEAELKAAGEPIDDLTRQQIKDAMTYYANGGEKDTVFNSRKAAPSDAEQAQGDAQEAYVRAQSELANAAPEDKKAAVQKVSSAYDDLLAAHGEGPLGKPDIKQDDRFPSPANDIGTDENIDFGPKGVQPVTTYSTQELQQRLKEAYPDEQPQMAPQPVQQQQANAGNAGGGTPSEPDANPVAGSPAAPEAPETPETDTRPLEERIVDHLNSAQDTKLSQDEINKGERRERLDAANRAGKGLQGEEKLRAQKSAMAGEFQKAEFKAPPLSEDDASQLYKKIEEKLGDANYDSLNARTGLSKMLAGKRLVGSEIRAMRKVFSPDMMDAVVAKRLDPSSLIEDAKTYGDGQQSELFAQGDTLHTPPAEPDQLANQEGTLFHNPPAEPRQADNSPLIPQGQTLSKGPQRAPLAPEPKPVDPDAFVKNQKTQYDLFEKDAGKGPPTATPKRGSTKFSKVVDLLNLPRALSSSLDMSAPFTQAGFLAHRGDFWKNFAPMVKAWGPEEAYKRIVSSITSDANYEKMKEANIAFTRFGEESPHEDNFSSRIAGKIPGIDRSERSYSAFLNKMRADTFNRLYNSAKEFGEPSAEQLKAIGAYVNNATGRGHLGRFEGAAPLLNSMFFSPRLQVSRIRLFDPRTYSRLPPGARAEALQDLVRFGGMVAGVAAIGTAAGGKADLNPLSNGFGHLKFGNVDYDMTDKIGGYARLAAQAYDLKHVVNGETVGYGRHYGDQTNLDSNTSFLINKLNPVLATLADRARGKDLDGDKFSWGKEARMRLLPMFGQDLASVLKDKGLGGAGYAAPSFLGVPTNVRTPKAPTQKQLQEMFVGPSSNVTSGGPSLTDFSKLPQ